LKIAFSPDGKVIALGKHFVPDSTTYASVELRDVENGRIVASLFGHTGHVISIAYSPDGKTLATGSRDATVRVWDVAAKKEIVVLRENEAEVWGVAFSPDGKLLATGSVNGLIKIWDTSTWKASATLPTDGSDKVVYSPDGKYLAAARGEVDAIVWRAGKFTDQIPLEGHSSTVMDITFSPDGSTVATGSLDKTIRLWNTTTFKTSQTIHVEHGVQHLAYMPDGKTLAASHGDGFIDLYDVATGKQVRRLKDGSERTPVRGIAVSPDGRLFASASPKGILIWIMATKEK
jgi:WD40 repeat protein